MNCLTPSQLADIALGLDSTSETEEHAKQCPACRDAIAAIQQLGDQLTAVHAPLGDVDTAAHAAARKRLLASLPATPQTMHSVNPIRRFFSRLGGLTVKQRIAFGGAGVAAALTLAALSLVSTPHRASAMERMAASLREATSYSMDLIQEVQGDTATVAILWRAPHSYRTEANGEKGAFDRHTVDVYSSEQPGISIDHSRKTYRRQPARRGDVSPLMMFEALGDYRGQADRELGTKEVAGRPARGFVIDTHKIDPDIQPGRVEIWIDAETNLPAQIRWELTDGGAPATMRMENFRWNVDLADALFEPTPPEGYKDKTPEPPSIEEVTQRITDALRLYARLSDGHYPRVKTIYGDVMRNEMLKLSGIEGRPTREEMLSEEHDAIMNASIGMGTMSQLFRNNADISYHGLTVDADDTDAVLLRWRLDDGRYQVIYGDLESKTISAGEADKNTR